MTAGADAGKELPADQLLREIFIDLAVHGLPKGRFKAVPAFGAGNDFIMRNRHRDPPSFLDLSAHPARSGLARQG